MVFRQRQQAIDNLKARILIWPIDARNLHKLLITQIIAQRRHRFDKACRDNRDGDFAMAFDNMDHILAKHLGNGIGNTCVAGIARGRMHQRVTVPERRIFRCNCMIPYSNASAVGGQPGT